MTGRSPLQELVTVGIIAWNRQDDTMRAVESVFAQTYRPLEIILADASYRHQISQAIINEFPDLCVIRLHRNLGCPEARNLIYANARSEIVLTIDDDSTLPEGTIAEIVRAFSDDPRIGIVACNVVEQPTPEGRAQRDEERDVFHFNGQCAIRKSVMEDAGYYPDNFLRQGEEDHLALRVIECGYRIRYVPSAVILHNRSSIGRDTEKIRYYYGALNDLQTIFELLPWYLIPAGLLYKALVWGRNAIKSGTLPYVIWAMATFLYRIPGLSKRHRPVSLDVWKNVAQGRRKSRGDLSIALD